MSSPLNKNVIVDPDVITFKPSFEKPQFANVKITNASEKLCLFKVMATHPKNYRIKNHVGALKQFESKIAVVKLESNITREQMANNIIIIQSALTDQEPQSRDNFWKVVTEKPESSLQYLRLKVFLEDQEEHVKSNKMVAKKDSSREQSTKSPRPDEGPSKIRLDPQEIVFQGPYSDIQTRGLTIFNLTEKFLYFRFLTSNDDYFRLRPIYAYIPPLSNKAFAIMIRSLSQEELDTATKKKYRIRIEYIEADDKTDDIANVFKRDDQRIFKQSMGIYIKNH